MVPNGPLEMSSARVELRFEVGDILFKERLIFMTTITSPLTGLFFLYTNSTNLVMRQGVLKFNFFQATRIRRQCVYQITS